MNELFEKNWLSARGNSHLLICTGHSCTTLWVKNSLKIALSLTVFEILTLFHFRQKSKMAAESGENLNFPPFHRRLLYHPVVQNFARDRSISYGFRDIDTFSFSAKIQDGGRKWRKLKFLPLDRRLLYHPVDQKFAGNRSISYGFRDIDTFSFSAKIQDGRQKWRKLKFSPFPQDTLVPLCGSKIRSKWLYLLRFSRY